MAYKSPYKTAFIILLSAAFILMAACTTVKEAPESAESAVLEAETESALMEAAELEPEPEPTLEELAASLEAAWASSADRAAPEPLFTASAALPAGDRLARTHGTALGAFLADAERGFLAEYGIHVDFAFLNAELIRAGLPEGPVSEQDIERVLPFGQTICIAEMSGVQLNELFASIGALPQGAGGFAQVSDGVSYTLTFDETGFNGSISEVLVGGVPVDEERTYRVALNDFVAAGGNGYGFFLRDDVVKVKISIKLSVAIADYCSTHADSLYMKQGERITIHGGITD